MVGEEDERRMMKMKSTGIQADLAQKEIVAILEATGHNVCSYPNGIATGVRLEAIPNTRGVHVEVTHVVDLRTTGFGSSGLAIRAALLESVNRDLESVLSDVGLGTRVERRVIRTPMRAITIHLLRSKKGDSASLIHSTRTVYVVTRNPKPSLDLTWLTEPGRVLSTEEFRLACRNDAGFLLPELESAVVGTKWNALERGLRRGWFGVLALAAAIIAGAMALSSFIVVSSLLTLYLIGTLVAAPVSAWLFLSSRQELTSFQKRLSEEEENLGFLGDGGRISQSILLNEDKLRLLGDISFVVTPLMATMGNALDSGDVNRAAEISSSILDECVRLSPTSPELSRNAPISSDPNLIRFLSFFRSLGAKVDEEALALSYVALAGHGNRPLQFPELAQHVGLLNNTLYEVGVLRPDIKEAVDGRLNRRPRDELLEEFDRSMGEEDSKDIHYQVDTLADDGPSRIPQIPEADISGSPVIERSLIDEILGSSTTRSRKKVKEESQECDEGTSEDAAHESSVLELKQQRTVSGEEGGSTGT
jgi:hypothetical protein